MALPCVLPSLIGATSGDEILRPSSILFRSIGTKRLGTKVDDLNEYKVIRVEGSSQNVLERCLLDHSENARVKKICLSQR